MSNGIMSKEAQELIRLVGGPDLHGEGGVKADLSVVLRDHPELVVGLNEYMLWRDDQSRAIAKEKQAMPLSHAMSGVIKNLPKIRRKKKS